MVASVTSPITDYLNLQANQANLMASFQKTPDYTNAVSYYQDNIGKVTTVDQFLGNYRLLQTALSAFDLTSAISETGFLKQLLTQDPTQSTSLAQQANDPRVLAFAKTFWSLSQDSGKTVAGQGSVNAVIARYTNVQFDQWASDLNSDSALDTALTAQRTFQDSVDVSNVGALFAQYKQDSSVQSASDYYQANIGNVKTPADLVNDPKLLDVALTAFGIDPSTISTDTVTQLLTQTASDSTSVAANNPAYRAFASAFGTLNFDQGAVAASASSVKTVVSNYQAISFQKTVAANDTRANAALFGAQGAAQIAQVYADFQSESGVNQGAVYYTANAGKATNADDFVADPKLLDVALIAYGLDPSSISSATATSLLTQDPTSASSLAQQNPSETAFAEALAPTFTSGASADTSTIVGAFQQNEFAAALGADISQAQSQASADASVNESAAAPISDYQIIADSTLAAVVYGAAGQPSSLGALEPDQQVHALTNAGFDPTKLSQTGDISNLIEKYLANSGDQSGVSTDPILALFDAGSSGGSSGIQTIDTSLLFGGGSASGASNGDIVSLLI